MRHVHAICDDAAGEEQGKSKSPSKPGLKRIRCLALCPGSGGSRWLRSGRVPREEAVVRVRSVSDVARTTESMADVLGRGTPGLKCAGAEGNARAAGPLPGRGS